MRALGRINKSIATIVLLTSTVFVVQAVTLSSAAQARCIGVNKPVTSTLVIGGVTYVSETPASGTCNNNETYSASFRSRFAGLRASVWIQNNTVWTHYFGDYDTATYPYSYHDSNSHSLMNLCIDDRSTAWCGWGTNYVVVDITNLSVDATHNAFNGVNQGF